MQEFGTAPAPPTAIEAQPARQHVELPELNGLRGLAVLIVFASHASNFFLGGVIAGYGGGQMGVMLFFMLSGFLMALLYLDRPCDWRSQCNFAASRLARVYPLFASVVIASYLIRLGGSSLPVYPIRSFADLLEHLGFVHGIGALHTIGPEIIFYGLFIVLWRLYGRHMRSFAVAVAVLALASWLPVHLITSANSLSGLHDRLPYFLVGMLIATRYGRIAAAIRQRPFPAMLFWAAFVLFLGTLPQALKLWVDVPKDLLPQPWSLPWKYPFYLLSTAALFVATLAARPRWLSGRVMGYLGEISFGFYLLHAPTLMYMHQLLPGRPWLGIGLGLAITVALAGLLHVVLEAPARDFFRRLAARHLRHPAAAGSAERPEGT